MKRLGFLLISFSLSCWPCDAIAQRWYQWTTHPMRNIDAFAVVGSTVFAGTDQSPIGVFRSSDQGRTWIANGFGMNTRAILAFGTNGSDLYAATVNGVFQWSDRAASWLEMNDGLTNLEVSSLAVHNDVVFAANPQGYLLRWGKEGWYWERDFGTGFPNTRINDLHVRGRYLFAGISNSGIYRSSDEGMTWMPVNDGLVSLGIKRFASCDSCVCVFSDKYVYRSTNNGSSWTALFSEWNIGAIACTPSRLLVAIRGELRISSDKGATWRQTRVISSARIEALACIGEEAILAGTSGAGVLRSTDAGNTWADVNPTPNRSTVMSIYRDTSRYITGVYGNAAYWAGTSGEGVFTTDSFDAWTGVSEGLANMNVRAITGLGSTLFAGTDAGVFRSTNYGNSWSRPSYGLGGDTVFAFVTKGSIFFAGTDRGMFCSLDSGSSWTSLSSGLRGQAVVFLLASEAGMFAGTRHGLFRSDDDGMTWKAKDWKLREIGVNALIGTLSALYAGTNSGVFRSTDGGMSWEPRSSGLLRDTIYALAVTSRGIYAGTTGGVFESLDGGASWNITTFGWDDPPVRALELRGRHLVAGTEGQGIWSKDVSGIVGVDDSHGPRPTVCLLAQNYPNPFNPSTTIVYELPKSSVVRLSVFDLLGREVSVLVNERKNAGSYEVKFDARGLSSGVYLYRMQAGGYVETRKLLLVR